PSMSKSTGIATLAIVASLMASWASAQPQGAAAPAPRPAAVPPPAPAMLFSMTLENDTRLPLAQNTVTTPNVDLQLYGDGRNIVVATGKGDHFPRLFFGLCKGPCGFTLRDRNSYFDLR